MQAQDQLAILEQARPVTVRISIPTVISRPKGFCRGITSRDCRSMRSCPGWLRPVVAAPSGAFLQRARFLAIAEFGPRSLIYHEGRAFRVVKAKLSPEARTEGGRNWPRRTSTSVRTAAVGTTKKSSAAMACGAPMADTVPVRRTLRIEQRRGAPAERITANDEERVRQGFDIQTVLHGRESTAALTLWRRSFRVDDRSLLTLQYANSADISRINKGLKRRREATVLGFMIDPRTGYWTKSEEESADTEPPPDEVRPVRIVPIVRDRKNALLLKFSEPGRIALDTRVTLQHALIRGTAVEFQLEDGELLGEPLPSRDDRRAILAYEATEGGAGVLHRLIEETRALNRVARRALDLMHFEGIDEAIDANDPIYLRLEKARRACAAATGASCPITTNPTMK